MINSLDQLEQFIQFQIETKNFELALESIKDFVERVVFCPWVTGDVLSSPLLDELNQKIGKEICNTQNPTLYNYKPQKNVEVYIVTQLYTSGGHTAVIEDLIQAQPTKKHIILLTDIFDFKQKDSIKKRFEDSSAMLIWAPPISLTEKVNWLREQIHHFSPQRLSILAHHQDSVAIAALQPDLPSECFFWHLADHHLCLGVHIPHFIHIDSHPMGFYNCCNKLGIKNNLYLPIVTKDLGTRPEKSPFLSDGKLITCSSGSANKFETPYLYQYVEIIPQVLKKTEGKHIHIGPLSQKSLDLIHNGLKYLSRPKESFIHIPWVQSVWKSLIEQKVDLYITSFPLGGGKAGIEAMGSGIPIAVHSNYKSQLLGGECFIYPQRFCWRKPQQLLDYISNLSPSILKEQSSFARKHYEDYHRPEILENELNKDVKDMKVLTPPHLPDFNPDKLQIAFDLSIKIKELESKITVLTIGNDQALSILNSTSWRITAPLRQLKEFYNSLKIRGLPKSD